MAENGKSNYAKLPTKPGMFCVMTRDYGRGVLFAEVDIKYKLVCETASVTEDDDSIRQRVIEESITDFPQVEGFSDE